MLTASQIKQASPLRGVRQVKFDHVDEHGDEQWLIVCSECMGVGIDMASDEVLTCAVCDGMGEFGPFDEDEVRAHLADA